MAAFITVNLQIFKRLQLLSFSTDLDETGIKIHGLLRSFKKNIVIVRVAVPFNLPSIFKGTSLISNILSYFENNESPIICYEYN